MDRDAAGRRTDRSASAKREATLRNKKCVASKGLTGAFFCKCGREWTYGIFWSGRVVGGMPEGVQEASSRTQTHYGIIVTCCQVKSRGVVGQFPVRLSSGDDFGRRAAPFTQPCYRQRLQCAFCETRATNSSNLESKSLRMGDLFDFL